MRLLSKPRVALPSECFEDCQVATLRRYVEAIGASLELVAQFGDKRISIVGIHNQPVTRPVNKELQKPGPSRRLRRRSGARS
jgi:hypothetical protein